MRKKREVEARDEEQVTDRSMATGISSPARNFTKGAVFSVAELLNIFLSTK